MLTDSLMNFHKLNPSVTNSQVKSRTLPAPWNPPCTSFSHSSPQTNGILTAWNSFEFTV